MATDDNRRLVQGQRVVSDAAEVEGPTTMLGGAGMAIYALMLGVLWLVAVGVLGVASYQLLQQSSGSWSELEAGNAVEVWRLAPMRDAGLIGVDSPPLAWHDESTTLDGTIACALLADAVVRIEGGVGSRLAYTTLSTIDVQGSEADGVEVRLVGPEGAFTCHFRPQEGGERFGRQVRAAAGSTR
jgi:hypothetical protein